jgi:uncharacterized RDD family membrane protein YckC
MYHGQKLATIKLRAFALLLDMFGLMICYQIIVRLNIPDITLNTDSKLISSGIIMISMQFLYLCVLPVYLHGRTLGKMAFGIRIVTLEDTPLTLLSSFKRNWIGYIFSSCAIGLGYIWALNNEKQQTWHDIFAGTVVIVDSALADSRVGNS